VQFVWAPGYESEGGFLNTILACILGLGSFIYGNVIQKSMHQRRSFVARTKVSAARHSPPIDETLDWLLPIVLITLGMLIKLYVIWSLGGPSGAIARLSGGARDRLDLYDANAPLIALRTLSGIADAGATWLLINCVRRRKRLLLPLIIFSLVLATSYITIGKRLVLILPIVAVLLAWPFLSSETDASRRSMGSRSSYYLRDSKPLLPDLPTRLDSSYLNQP